MALPMIALRLAEIVAQIQRVIRALQVAQRSVPNVRAKSNFGRLQLQIQEDQRRIRICTAIALTKTAKKCEEAVKVEMATKLDRPTRYTMNGLYVRPANINRLQAEIGVKGDAVKGTPANYFLSPNIHGGERRQKRFEKALAATGLLPDGMYAVPGAGAKLDASGNMSRGQIMQVLSALKAAEQRSGYLANRTKRSAKRGKKANYFVGRPGGGRLPLGVWQYTRGSGTSRVIPIMIFVRQANYRPRVNFYDVVDETAAKWFPIFFDQEMAKKK